jgi:hypothetical protein
VSGIMSMMAPGGDGTVRMWLMAAAAAVCLTLALAGAAHGSGNPPRLLAIVPGDRTALTIRPRFMSFDHSQAGRTSDYLSGPGLTQQGFQEGRQPPIVWSRWGGRAAGQATFWLGYSTACGACRYHRYEVRLAAWRVRRGRYTRLSITGPGGTNVYAFEPTRLAVNGRPGGLAAYTWCFTDGLKPCLTP